MDAYGVSITFEKGKCLLSDRKFRYGVFGTLNKKDSDDPLTARVKNVNSSPKASFNGYAVLSQKVGTHGCWSEDALCRKGVSHTNYLPIKEMIRSSKYEMNTETDVKESNALHACRQTCHGNLQKAFCLKAQGS